MTAADRFRFDLNDVRLLLEVIDNGGFTAASRVTGIAKSTLSQRITALEKSIGTSLLRRTSRSLSLTNAGKMLLVYARELDAVARRAELDLRGLDATVSGPLRVSSSIAMAQFALGQVTPSFLSAHPGVSLQLHSTNRFVDLVAEGYDLAVRSHSGPLRDSTLVQRVIGRFPWILAAAPSYLVGETPRTPADLAAHDLLFFGTVEAKPAWTLRSGSEEVTIDVTPRLWSRDMRLLRRACVEGAGIVALPAYIVARSIEAGQLRRVLPEWLAGQATLSLILPPRGQGSHAGSMYAEHLATTLPAILEPGLQVIAREKPKQSSYPDR